MEFFTDTTNILVSKGEIDCTTRSNPGHPGGSDFSLIGDCGSPRAPWDSPSLSSQGRAEQWPVCPLVDDWFFLVRPVMWTGYPRFPRLKDNQVGAKLNLCLQIWVWQLFHVLIVKLRHLLGTCNNFFSPYCSLIISLQFGTCLVPLGVCIHVKHIKFHLINLPVIIVFEKPEDSMDLAFWGISVVYFIM